MSMLQVPSVRSSIPSLWYRSKTTYQKEGEEPCLEDPPPKTVWLLIWIHLKPLMMITYPNIVAMMKRVHFERVLPTMPFEIRSIPIGKYMYQQGVAG